MREEVAVYAVQADLVVLALCIQQMTQGSEDTGLEGLEPQASPSNAGASQLVKPAPQCICRIRLGIAGTGSACCSRNSLGAFAELSERRVAVWTLGIACAAGGEKMALLKRSAVKT